MDKTELEYKTELESQQRLMQAMELSDKAEITLEVADKWLEDYQGWITNSLKTCQDNQVMGLRNLLVVSEAFKTWLKVKIDAGAMAASDLQELREAAKEPKVTDDWYKNL